MSALATDSKSFILRFTSFNFNTKFSSQQSEVTTARVLVSRITRHLLPLGATARVEHLSLNVNLLECFLSLPVENVK